MKDIKLIFININKLNKIISVWLMISNSKTKKKKKCITNSIKKVSSWINGNNQYKDFIKMGKKKWKGEE